MTHYGVLVGTLILLVFSVSALLLILLARTVGGKPKHKDASSQTTIPNVVNEIYIDKDTFTLIGPDWTWLADQPADYGCPRCGKRENVTLRHFRYAYGNKVFLVALHHCERADADQITRPMAMVGGE